MNKKTKIVLIAFFLLLGVLGVLYASSLISQSKFPVSLFICDPDYTHCSTLAKFDEMFFCQSAAEKSGWVCDDSNKNDIRCRVGDNAISISYCED